MKFIFSAKSLLSVTGRASGFLFHTQITLSTSVLWNLLLFYTGFFSIWLCCFLWTRTVFSSSSTKRALYMTCLADSKHFVNVCRMNEWGWESKWMSDWNTHQQFVICFSTAKIKPLNWHSFLNQVIQSLIQCLLRVLSNTNGRYKNTPERQIRHWPCFQGIQSS